MVSEYRLLFFRYAAYICIALLLIFLFKIQILDGAYFRKRSEHNRIRLIPIKSTRGRILDRNGMVIAGNKPSFNLYVIPEDLYEDSYSELAAIVNIPVEEITKKMSKLKGPSFVPVLLKKDLSQEEVHALEEKSTDFGGIQLSVSGRRHYPYENVASHIIGYIGKINADEYTIKKHVGYLIDDYIGRIGIESIFEEVLKGEHGGRQIEVDARGREIREIASRAPYRGSDISLTIDIELQKKIKEVIKEETATVCLMDIKTGEIIALVSNPSFDPNTFVIPSKSEERLSLLKDETLPFLNRAISSRYPPGSVFKIVIALAALEQKLITQHTKINCEGEYKLTPNTRAFKCWNRYGHGDVDLVEALQQSCNVYFYVLGRKLGADGISQFAKKIGLADELHFELPSSKSLIPSTQWKKEKLNKPWYQGETLHFAIGQGYLAVTPLQVLRLIALIANDGTVIEPTIIKGVVHDPKSFKINKANIGIVKKGMLKAVDTDYGTAHVAKVEFFKVAGKTGTAQNKGEPHSWFAGFFPYNDPEIALVSMVEHGGVGGGKAAQIAKQCATLWHESRSKAK